MGVARVFRVGAAARMMGLEQATPDAADDEARAAITRGDFEIRPTSSGFACSWEAGGMQLGPERSIGG